MIRERVLFKILSQRAILSIKDSSRLMCSRCGAFVKEGDLVQRTLAKRGVQYEHVACIPTEKRIVVTSPDGVRSHVLRENLKGRHGETPIISSSEKQQQIKMEKSIPGELKV
jgi:hypothetical protein